MTASTLTVANALKALVSASFPAVGFVTAGTPETAVQARSLPAGLRPPCVLILAGDGVYTDSTLTRRQQCHLILIDVLAGTNDARTAAALGRFDALQQLFPAHFIGGHVHICAGQSAGRGNNVQGRHLQRDFAFIHCRVRHQDVIDCFYYFCFVVYS